LMEQLKVLRQHHKSTKQVHARLRAITHIQLKQHVARVP